MPLASGLAGGEQLQALEASDAVLEMHHVVAFLQLAEIDVHRRAGGECVRRFHASRPLDFVASEDLRVRHHHESGCLANETARQGTEGQPLERGRPCPGGRGGCQGVRPARLTGDGGWMEPIGA